MKTYNLKLITFLSQGNTIMIRSTYELQKLQKILSHIRLEPRKYIEDDVRKNGPIYLEYDNCRGFTYYTNKQNSIDWYEKEPFTMEEIIEETSE